MLAAPGRRACGKFGIADMHRDVARLEPEFLRDHLCQDRSDAGAEILHARQDQHRAVALEPHLTGCIGIYVGAPQRLRHADAALDRARIGGRLVALFPVYALRADPAFLAAHRARVDALAQCQRIDAELVGQLIDRLLHGEGAGRVAGSAHRRAAAGVDEHVVLRGGEVRAGVERLGEVAGARADPHASSAELLQRYRCQSAVAKRADP